MICLLCVNKKRDMIEIFGDEGKGLSIADIIAKYFWFELNPDDDPTKLVCKQCWKKTNDFHLFYTEVEENQPIIRQLPTVHITKAVLLDESNVITKNEIEEIKYETSTVINDEEFELEKIEEPVDGLVKYEQFSDFSDDENKSVIDRIVTTLDVIGSPTKEKIRKAKPSKENVKKRKVKKVVKEITPQNAEMAKKQKESYIKNNNDQHKIMEFCKMECDLCNSEFKDWSEVKNHYRNEHKIKGYVYCTCCNEKFTRRFRILDHIEYRENPSAFKCEICDKLYEHRDSLQNHLQTHKPLEERLFKCDKCDKCYAKKGLLGAHIRTRHVTDEDKKFACPECGSRFATQAILNSHVRGVHEGAYIHVCEICAKVFKSKMFFEKHKINVHSISPPPKIQCQNCGNWLKESSMRSHVHSCHERQEKGMHVCNICGKESPNSRALQSHKRFVHLAQKLHQCSVCDKAFKRAITLREHMTVHTGEVLYSCTYCPKTFNSNANMHAHRKKIHKAQWEENQLRSK